MTEVLRRGYPGLKVRARGVRGRRVAVWHGVQCVQCVEGSRVLQLAPGDVCGGKQADFGILSKLNPAHSYQA